MNFLGLFIPYTWIIHSLYLLSFHQQSNSEKYSLFRYFVLLHILLNCSVLQL